MKKPVRVILTGSTGLFGRAVLATVPPHYRIFPVYFHNPPLDQVHKFSRIDITKKQALRKFFDETQPDVVIHAASLGNVDYCERNPAEADLVNVSATHYITDLCRGIGSRLIFTSSNAVFDGTSGPYSEDSPVHPVNHYGQTKVLGERLVLSSPDNSVARFTLMYGWNNSDQRSNAVTWLLDKLRRGEEVKLVHDTYVNPVLNLQAASCVWRIITQNKTGIYHIAGRDRLNRYEFGLKTARVFGFRPALLKPVPSNYFPGLAKRMPDTTFKTAKMESELHQRPLTIMAGLKIMKHVGI